MGDWHQEGFAFGSKLNIKVRGRGGESCSFPGNRQGVVGISPYQSPLSCPPSISPQHGGDIPGLNKLLQTPET